MPKTILVGGQSLVRRNHAGCTCNTCDFYYADKCPAFQETDNNGHTHASKRKHCPSWTPVSRELLTKLNKETF